MSLQPGQVKTWEQLRQYVKEQAEQEAFLKGILMIDEMQCRRNLWVITGANHADDCPCDFCKGRKKPQQ